MWNFEEAEDIRFVNDYAAKRHAESCAARAEEGVTIITHRFDGFWLDEQNNNRPTYDALVVIDWTSNKTIRRYTMDEIALANQDYKDNDWEHAEAQMPY